MGKPLDSNWMQRLAGRFLVLDGPDGSGKSTQLQKLVDHAQKAGLSTCVVREPGGTPIGEHIRRVLLDKDSGDIDLRCEMLLYMASRAQLVSQRIAPALAQKQLVLADRFVSSTLAYQGTAGGLPEQDILQAARIAVGPCWPDLTVIFDVDDRTAAARLLGKQKKRHDPHPDQPSLFADRMELKGSDYHRRVRQGYLEQAKTNPDRYELIDASGEADAVFDTLLACLKAKSAHWTDQPTPE